MHGAEVFEPKNPLEHKLVAARESRIADRAFVKELLASNVYVPLQNHHGIEGLEEPHHVEPLVVTTDRGTDVLVLFSDANRARPFLSRFPGYEHGLLAEFQWVLEKLGGDYGISLNPGWSAGFDIAPDLVRQLRGR